MGAYRLGAVVYHPKVEQIWSDFGRWFDEQGLALDAHYYDSYDDQVNDLLTGELDTAWNTNLAHVQAVSRTGGEAGALAMRDTDRDWRSMIVARADAGIAALDDLHGRTLGFGDSDSPQAQILPVHFLREQGFDPERACTSSRLDRDVGKHGDTGGAELAQLARVRARELDACLISSVTHDAVTRLGDATDLNVVWASPPYHHCCFTVLDGGDHHDRFRELLLSMDASDPKLCEPMELEYVNRWVPFDPGGYLDLERALEAGPVLVG